MFDQLKTSAAQRNSALTNTACSACSADHQRVSLFAFWRLTMCRSSKLMLENSVSPVSAK